MAGLHHRFDAETAAGTDKRGNWKGAMKYERPSFTVVTASDAYRKGWEYVFGKVSDEPADRPGSVGEHADRGGARRDD